MDTYLSTAAIGQAGGVDEGKIAWLELNFASYFTDKDASYLDIGPGQGDLMHLWRKMGIKNISSIDISKDVYEHVKKLGFECDLVEDSTKYLQAKTSKYDIIVLNDVLEHIPREEIVDFVGAISKSLLPGGKLLIKSPNAQSPHFGTGLYGDLTHVQAFSELSLSQLFRLTGFENYWFFAEKQPMAGTGLKGVIANYIFCPIYFRWVRFTRAISFHFNPDILTQAIIAVAEKSK